MSVANRLTGDPQTFTCVTGGSSSDLLFYHNGVKLENGVNGVQISGGSLTIASTTTDHTGMYQCIAENDSGSDGTSWFLIVRNPSEWSKVKYYLHYSSFLFSKQLLL